MGFVVQGAARVHIVADVGDRHDQAPAAALAALHVDRVVEVAGVLAVDGDQRQVAQVHPVGLGGMGHLGAEALGLLLHAVRPLMGNLEAAQGHVHFHARLIRGGDDFFQPHQHIVVPGRVLGDLGAHVVAGARLQTVVVLHQHFLGDAPVLRIDKGHAGLFAIATDDLGDRPLGDLDDARLFLAEAVEAGHADQHPVAVHNLLHLARRQKQVLTVGVVGDQEAETVPVGLHPAGDQVHARSDADLAVAVLHQLAVAQHRLETAFQPHFAVFAHLQDVGELMLAERLSLVVEDLEDQLTAGNRILVLFRFPIRVGILVAFPG